MIRVCVWCKQVFGEKEPLEDKSETHGICDTCLEIELKTRFGKGKVKPIADDCL